MIIGVDGNEANVKDQVGVSVYTRSLLEHFQSAANDKTQFRIFLKNDPLPTMPKENPHFSYKVISPRFMWSQLWLPLDLYMKKKIDVFFAPAHYAPRFCPAPLVVTVHDLSYFYYPDEFLKKDLYTLKEWTRYSVKNARKIIAVSKTTKKDVIKYYNVPEEKIEAVYNGYDKSSQPKADKLLAENLLTKLKLKEKKYFLYVGTLQPRKNLPVLINAFAKFSKIHADYKLVLVGKKGWMYDEIFETIRTLKLDDAVITPGYLPDEEVKELYRNAMCFVLPSLYEGFGIPILEAMSHGCPVISSFSSSLPEIGGDACLYFDPKNSEDLYDDLIRLTEDESLRKDFIKKGYERVKQFSWKKCAEETLNVIQKIENS
ncbi:MAG: glycosyltransferase family 1 protein [bacterium]|nr:glycosyltransferase family 1 protein [bacterium]